MFWSHGKKRHQRKKEQQREDQPAYGEEPFGLHRQVLYQRAFPYFKARTGRDLFFKTKLILSRPYHLLS